MPNRIINLRSRMELAPEEDHSNYICTCGHKLADHDFPAGKCLKETQTLKDQHEVTLLEVCDCKNFERYVEGYYDDEIN